MWKDKGTRQLNNSEKNKVGGVTLHEIFELHFIALLYFSHLIFSYSIYNFTTQYKATVIKT